MRHRVSGKKLGRDTAHRKALLRSLSISLTEHGAITTTLAKAKYVKPFFEKLITRARAKDELAVRELRRHLANEGAVRKLIDEIAPKFSKRPGGYTRIVKLSNRDGDNAAMARLELVQVKEPKKKVEKVAGIEAVETPVDPAADVVVEKPKAA